MVPDDPAQQVPPVSNDVRPRTPDPQPAPAQVAVSPLVRGTPAPDSDRVEGPSKNEEVKRVTKRGSVVRFSALHVFVNLSRCRQSR